MRDSRHLSPSLSCKSFSLQLRTCPSETSAFKGPEGQHPRGTTLREALRGNLPLRGLCRGLSGFSQTRRVLRGLCGFCGGPRDLPRFFGGSDPMLVTLRNCWICERKSPSPRPPKKKNQGAAKGVRQKEFDHFFSFSGRFRSLFGHFF